MSSSDRDKITERRLRSIFDALDGGQSKRAVGEADKILKKHADMHAARALKALALIRLQRHDEAAVILDTMPTTALCVHALQALTHCFKELNQPLHIVRLYSSAVTAMPGNDDYLAQLFMAHVRVLNFKKQQQIALQLIKSSTADNKSYHLWSVMSLIMQGVTDTSGKLADAMYFPLAAKTMAKALAASGAQQHTHREQTLHVLALHKAQQHQRLLALVDTLAADKTLDVQSVFGWHPLSIRASLGEHDVVIVECNKLLQLNPDDCAIYELMIESALKQIDDSVAVNDVIATISDMIVALVDTSTAAGRPYRGAHLARMQWTRRLLERDIVPRADLGEPQRLLVDYFVAFAAKPCAYADMLPFIEWIGEQQRADFVAVIEADAGLPCAADGEVTPKRVASDVAQLYRHVTCMSIGRRLGLHAAYTNEQRMQFVRQLLHRYENAFDKFLVRPQDLSMQPADSYLLLAAQLLWDMYAENSDMTLVADMIVLLERAYARSPANKALLFVLGRCYGAVSAGACVYDVGQRLRIKAVQHDSVGYVTMDQLTANGLYAMSAQQCHDLTFTFDDSLTQLNEQLVGAYHKHKFAHIVDMCAMHRRLTRSVHRVYAFTVGHYVHVLCECDSVRALTAHLLRGESGSIYRLMAHANCDDIGLALHDTSDALDWATLADNRDLNILPLAMPADYSADAEKSATSDELVDTMRLQYLLLRCLAELCRCVAADERSAHDDRLYKITGELKSHYAHCRQTYTHAMTRSLHAPAPTMLAAYVTGPYFALVDTLLDMAYLMACRRRHSGGSDRTAVKIYDARLMSDSSLASSVSSASSALSALSVNTTTSESGISSEATTMNGLPTDRADVLPTAEAIQTLCRRLTSDVHLSSVHRIAATIPSTALAQQTVGVALLVCLLIKRLAADQDAAVVDKASASSWNGTSCGVQSRVNDIVSVVCQTPATVHKVVHDMHELLVKENKVNPLARTYGLVDDRTLPNALRESLQSTRERVGGTVRESYYQSLVEMTALGEHQNRLANTLRRPC